MGGSKGEASSQHNQRGWSGGAGWRKPKPNPKQAKLGDNWAEIVSQQRNTKVVHCRSGEPVGGGKMEETLVLALGVSSTSLSAANMSAPLFGVLKMVARAVLQERS